MPAQRHPLMSDDRAIPIDDTDELAAERDRWQQVCKAEATAHHATGLRLDRMTAERDALWAYARILTAFALEEDAASAPAIAKMQEVAGVSVQYADR